jgi:anti-sigma factor RsiW
MTSSLKRLERALAACEDRMAREMDFARTREEVRALPVALEGAGPPPAP